MEKKAKVKGSNTFKPNIVQYREASSAFQYK